MLAPIAVHRSHVGARAGDVGPSILTQGLALKVLRDLQNAMFAKLMHVDFARIAREEPAASSRASPTTSHVVGEAWSAAAQAAFAIR
jgi:hypothetical protein